MFKIALGIEYDGTDFNGWQCQVKDPSVQVALEKALSRVADHPVHTVCAGRTDTGVHALGQVVHFDCQHDRKENAWLLGANTYLPTSIRILWARVVPIEFSARRSALSRRYSYIIYNHRIRPSLLRHQVTWYYKPLDAEKMNEAAQHWLGEHDFSSFRSSQCQSKSSVRDIKAIEVFRANEVVVLNVKGNAFLHHMVRNMAGVLMRIGSGEAATDWAKTVLAVCDRRKASITAPPHGLYLVSVEYPAHFQLPNDTIIPWYLRSSRNELVS